MAHDHDHSHAGHHHHVPEIKSLNTAFVVGIILNLGYVLIQVFIGLNVHSLSILSDAGHNFLDVAGLALAMLAFKLSKSKSTESFTYGYRKVSILVSLFNAVILLLSIGAIAYEAIVRFSNPEPIIPGLTIAIIAGIGIVINGISAFMFFKDKDSDINVKSAFLHLMSDALVSLGLVIGGIIIYYTKFYWIDSVLSLLICLVIITSTWKLLKDSLKLSLDGVPENVDVNKLKEAALKIKGVQDIHHLHVWAISTTNNALTAHIVLDGQVTLQETRKIKDRLKHDFEHLNIQHATLETETLEEDCKEEDC